MGKTASAERRAKTVFQLDTQTHRQLAEADPAQLLGADPPVLLDQWQHVPAVWDSVRRAVDQDPRPNRYLLAGSMAPTSAPTSGEGDVLTKNTVIAYREVLTRLWIIEPVPGWLPSRSHLARLTQSPEHQLADPALAARLLGIGEEALLSGGEPASAVQRDGTFLGQLFESLLTLSVSLRRHLSISFLA